MKPGDLDRPWLVAAWPGMGMVALRAATFLVRRLNARPVGEIPPETWFDVSQVTVKDALIGPAVFPRSTLHAWKNPVQGGRDLLVFLGEAQPGVRGYAFCRELVARAMDWDVSRVITFAAMATPVHPRAPARGFAAANRAALLADLKREGAVLLGEGEISGLNGVLVAAATERGLEGACLLGEFPYFASGFENPKASAAVLRVFGRLAGIPLDLAELDAQAAELEGRFAQILERLQRSAESLSAAGGPAAEASGVGEGPDETEEESGGEGQGEASGEGASEGGPAGEGGGDAEAAEGPEAAPGPGAEPGLRPLDRARIERLFDQAAKDRHKALELKAELDRLGVFKAYEDRFLDLFRRGE